MQVVVRFFKHANKHITVWTCVCACVRVCMHERVDFSSVFTFVRVRMACERARVRWEREKCVYVRVVGVECVFRVCAVPGDKELARSPVVADLIHTRLVFNCSK